MEIALLSFTSSTRSKERQSERHESYRQLFRAGRIYIGGLGAVFFTATAAHLWHDGREYLVDRYWHCW